MSFSWSTPVVVLGEKSPPWSPPVDLGHLSTISFAEYIETIATPHSTFLPELETTIVMVYGMCWESSGWGRTDGLKKLVGIIMNRPTGAPVCGKMTMTSYDVIAQADNALHGIRRLKMRFKEQEQSKQFLEIVTTTEKGCLHLLQYLTMGVKTCAM
ncbi:hypothetical protein POM88_023035 [Heracleum sosnowskyi]|uniref:Uncharacterized protein n=1 Tax=Heracleum sosnowskyi TaxID=360622 RepID=A0AAD8IJX1_9APIA|nr:hypothetical protein POM88_023035 [Heracleum sosnowskyi]